MSNRWQITLASLDDYRKNKYSRMKRKINGEQIYNIEAGRWPIQFMAKWLGDLLNKPISENRIYYLIKIGHIPAYRAGNGWVVKREDAEAYYLKLMNLETTVKEQLRFA